MRISIDSAGRVVIPKPIRDELKLKAGDELEATLRDGRIEIEPRASHVRLVERDGRSVIEPEGDVPILTAEKVRQVLERTRR